MGQGASGQQQGMGMKTASNAADQAWFQKMARPPSIPAEAVPEPPSNFNQVAPSMNGTSTLEKIKDVVAANPQLAQVLSGALSATASLPMQYGSDANISEKWLNPLNKDFSFETGTPTALSLSRTAQAASQPKAMTTADMTPEHKKEFEKWAYSSFNPNGTVEGNTNYLAAIKDPALIRKWMDKKRMGVDRTMATRENPSEGMQDLASITGAQSDVLSQPNLDFGEPSSPSEHPNGGFQPIDSSQFQKIIAKLGKL